MTTRPPIHATCAAVACLLWAVGLNSAAAAAQEQRIGPGDILRIRISGLPGRETEPTDLFRVDETGCVELPRIGTTDIADLSESEAVDFLLDRYRGDGFNPDVTVRVLEKGRGADSMAPSAGVVAPATGPTTSPSVFARWGEALGRIDVGRPILGGIVAALLAGIALAWRLRGRRIDDHPLCRRCAFDLFGLPPGHPRCPECGADLLRRPRKAVRVGHRERRAAALATGIILLLPAASALSVVTWSTWQRTDVNEWKPAWWLARDLKSPDAKVRGAAIAHLSGRLAGGKLSRGDVDRAVRQLLAIQADLSRPWSTVYGDFIEDAGRAELVSAEYRETYFVQAVPAEILPPGRVRDGSIFPVKVRVGPARLGKSLRPRVEFVEPRVEVAGRAVDRRPLEVISSFVLGGNDAADMEDGKLTVYNWAQLPHGSQQGVQPVRLTVDLPIRFDSKDADGVASVVRHVEWTGPVELLPPERAAD